MSEEAGIDWEDGGETLPSGWMKRPEFGQNENERIFHQKGINIGKGLMLSSTWSRTGDLSL